MSEEEKGIARDQANEGRSTESKVVKENLALKRIIEHLRQTLGDDKERARQTLSDEDVTVVNIQISVYPGGGVQLKKDRSTRAINALNGDLGKADNSDEGDPIPDEGYGDSDTSDIGKADVNDVMGAR